MMKVALLFSAVALFAGDKLFVTPACPTDCSHKNEQCGFANNNQPCCEGFGLQPCGSPSYICLSEQMTVACPGWMQTSDSMDFDGKTNDQIKMDLDDVEFCGSGKSATDALADEVRTLSGDNECLTCAKLDATTWAELKGNETYCEGGFTPMSAGEEETSGVAPVAAKVGILTATGAAILHALLD